MRIRGHELDVEVSDELEPYMDELYKGRVRGNKLQACSPFRSESTPSFAVNLETGTWIDSGATDDVYDKGNFIKLLAFLQGVTYEETEDYLLEKYKTILADVDSLTLDVQLDQKKRYMDITADTLKQYLFRSPYLGKRGITEQVQRAFKIGYDKKSKAVTLVWHDKDGQPINVKFRSIKDKRFWYIDDGGTDEDKLYGQPIKQHIYGLHFIHKMEQSKAYVTESETDALYLWSNGVPAIALGSASLSRRQEELIHNSPITDIVLAFDNDEAGIRCKNNVAERLMGQLKVWELKVPAKYKDVNDIPQTELAKLINNTKRIIPAFL